MVSTRHHPRQFPEPTTPAARSTKSTPASKARSTSTSTSRSRPASPTSPSSPVSNALDAISNAVAKPRVVRKRKSTVAMRGRSYAHVIDRLTIIWLYISLPLVVWDTGYVLLRPHSMPGGRLHSPIFSPYALYGSVDFMYGWPAWNDGVGFTAAQASVNIIETLMYSYYLYVLAIQGAQTGWYKAWERSFYTEKTIVKGQGVALAVVIAFAAATMSVSKTVLYWLNEYFARFENVGHNSVGRLIFLYLIPSGAWIVCPGWMMYVLGKEMINAMHLAGTSGLEKID